MERVVAPVVTSRPTTFRLTDSGDDFHIALDRLGTYVAEMLVAVHLFEERGPRLPAIRPTLHDWFEEVHLKRPGPLPAPEIEINHETLRTSQRTASRALFYSGVTQLVSSYEVHLGSIAQEIYLYNHDLLSLKEQHLTNSEIISLGSYDHVVGALVSRAASKLTALSYPALVKRFNREFQVSIHHSTSPATLFTVHHLIEQRNIIVHNDGYVSDQYLERLSAYEVLDRMSDDEDQVILREHQSVPVNFKRFFDLLYLLSDLGNYIDGKVKERWATSTS